jgi:serine phosphatase RsbU (regulator of sigma subunit)/anti-anti-sigma regulatory factor
MLFHPMANQQSNTSVSALVVDDDSVTRSVVRDALRALGINDVYEANDGVAAQDRLREHPDLDLVLTDIVMPKLDGLGLVRWARDHAPGPTWIVLSALDRFDTAVEAARLGAFDFLAKPPRIEELEVSVRNALERRRLLREQARLHAELEQTNQALLSKVRELERKSELIQRDLQRAEVIQRALLPKAPPPIERYSVHAMYRPGRYVGGDLYDVVRLSHRHLAMYVADATGHGVTAAMLSVLFKQQLVMVNDDTGDPLAPAVVLHAANQAMADALAAPGLFLTAVYALIDLDTGSVKVASAGHPPAVLERANHEIHVIRRTGPALGLSADARYREEMIQLGPDDRLLMYTDGLLQYYESGSESNPIEPLIAAHPSSSREVLEQVMNRVKAAGNAQEPDDVTLVWLDMHVGPSEFENATSWSDREPEAQARVSEGVISYGDSEQACFLAIRGRGTWAHSDAFYEAADAILDEHRPLIIDLGACEYLDSTFLGTIHQLVSRGRVRLQRVLKPVADLFEELSMDQVLASIQPNGAPLPELFPIQTGELDPAARRLRILRAHETLAALSPQNQEKFKAVLEAIRSADT